MDIVCFSHLRWNFVYQRPQHLLSRFAHTKRVFYFEEPFFDAAEDHFTINKTKENVQVVVLHLKGSPAEDAIQRQKRMVQDVFVQCDIRQYILWYYTPMALLISDQLHPQAVVYDCMDELSAFKFAPPLLTSLEKQLFSQSRPRVHRRSYAVRSQKDAAPQHSSFSQQHRQSSFRTGKK